MKLNICCSKIVLTVIAFFLSVYSLQAGQRAIINPSFELPDLDTCGATGTNYRQVNQDFMPGWETTHPSRNNLNCGPSTGRPIETWESGFGGVLAADGEQFVELNAFVASSLFQTVCVNNGESINWQFSHRGRNNTDTIRLTLGTQVLTTQSTSNAAWVTYTGTSIFTGTTGDNDFFFEAVGGGSIGNFLDNIQIFFLPYVEFFDAATSDQEMSGGNIPRLKLNGTISSAQSVDVVITGGTATTSDYTFVSTVNIPAGTYDGTAATAIPINLIINDNLDLEADRNLTFALANPTGGITVTDADCDTNFQSTSMFTIIDDDNVADLSIVKDDGSSQYSPGGNSAYTITVTNNGPANVVNAVVVDTLPAGFSLSTNWTCVPDVNSSCISGALDGTVANGSSNINQNVDLASGESIVFTVPIDYSPLMTDY